MNYLVWAKESLIYSDGETGKLIKADDPVLGKGKDYKIAVLAATPQIVKALPLEIEQASIRNFPADYKTCFQKIGEDLYQVFGTPDVIFNKIKDVIPPENIASLIPYPVVIEHLLGKRASLKPWLNFGDEHVIFIDDSKTSIVFTVFHHKASTSPRIIARENLVSDFNQGKEDYVREEKEFGITFRVITNSNTLKDELLQAKVVAPELITVWDMSYPALEGLKSCDTSVQFVLPEQITRKKELKQKRKHLISACITGIVAILGIMFYIYTAFTGKFLQNAMSSLQQDKTNWESQVLSTFQAKYHDIIRHEQDEIAISALNKIVKYSPIGYEIRDLNVRRSPDGTYQVVAFIVPQLMSVDEIKQVFPASSISTTTIHGMPAFRVNYAIDRQGREFAFRMTDKNP